MAQALLEALPVELVEQELLPKLELDLPSSLALSFTSSFFHSYFSATSPSDPSTNCTFSSSSPLLSSPPPTRLTRLIPDEPNDLPVKGLLLTCLKRSYISLFRFFVENYHKAIASLPPLHYEEIVCELTKLTRMDLCEFLFDATKRRPFFRLDQIDYFNATKEIKKEKRGEALVKAAGESGDLGTIAKVFEMVFVVDEAFASDLLLYGAAGGGQIKMIEWIIRERMGLKRHLSRGKGLPISSVDAILLGAGSSGTVSSFPPFPFFSIFQIFARKYRSDGLVRNKSAKG